MDTRLNFLFLSAFLSVMAILFNLLTIRLLFPLLKGMVSRNPNASPVPLFWLVAGVIAAAFIKNVLQYVATLSVSCQVRQITCNLRKLIFDRYLSFGKLFYDRTNIGRLNAVVVRFPQSIGSQLNMLHRMLAQILTLIAYGTVMVVISCGTQRVTRRVKLQAKSHAVSEERLEEKIFNVLSSIPLVQAHNMAREEKRRFGEVSDEEVRLSFAMDRKQKLLAPLQDFSMMTAFVMVACAILLITPAQTADALPGYLIFLYLVKLSLPAFGAINQFVFTLARSSARIQKVSAILDGEEKHRIAAGEKEFKGLRSKIEFHHPRFSYRRKNPVLRKVAFLLTGHIMGLHQWDGRKNVEYLFL